MHLVNRGDKRTQCARRGDERSERITNLQEQIWTAERPEGRGPGMARVNLSRRTIKKTRSPTESFLVGEVHLPKQLLVTRVPV